MAQQQRNEQVIQEFKRRRTRQWIVSILTIGLLAPIVAITTKHPEVMRGASFRGIPSIVLALIQLTALLGVVGFTSYNWRCPSCNKLLRQHHTNLCARCGVPLREPAQVEASRTQPERDAQFIKTFRKRRTRLLTWLGLSVGPFLLLFILAYVPPFRGVKTAPAADILGVFLGLVGAIAIVIYTGLYFFNWKCPACGGHFGTTFGLRLCPKCGILLR